MNRQNKKWILGKTALLALIALAFLLPLVWMITSSLKSTTEVFAVDWHWLPEQWRWDNYATVWTDPEVSMLSAYLNTVFITVVATAAQLFIASLAAYAFAKIRFRGKGAVFALFLATMMMPAEVMIVPRFILFNAINLYCSISLEV